MHKNIAPSKFLVKVKMPFLNTKMLKKCLLTLVIKDEYPLTAKDTFIN